MAPRHKVPALLLSVALVGSGCASTRDLDLGYPTGYSDEGYLYDEFASYGTWVDAAPYGWVWCPDVANAWQPYSVGYWAYTDYGWLWVSEDPWGSIPYHYGRWTFDDFYGWVWVPGDVWAAAWVSWRYGDGWVGWAPLPPDVVWYADTGVDLSPDDLDRRIRRHYWSYTKADEFGTRRERVRVESSDKHESLFERTRNVTKLAGGSRPVEKGLRPDIIRELRGNKMEPIRIVDAAKPGMKSGLRIRDGKAEVHRPQAQVKALVRDRSRAVPSAKESKTDVPAKARVERERVEREPAKRAPEPDREPATTAQASEREQVKPAQVAQRDVTREERDGDVRERMERVARQREEVARQRDEAAARREELQRQRDEEARQREEVARKRKQDEVAQQHEDAVQERAREREAEAKQREAVARERQRDAEVKRERDAEVKQREREAEVERRERERDEVKAPHREREIERQDPRERKQDTAHSEDRERGSSPKRARGPRTAS